jgi:hypothetical protein
MNCFDVHHFCSEEQPSSPERFMLVNTDRNKTKSYSQITQLNRSVTQLFVQFHHHTTLLEL